MRIEVKITDMPQEPVDALEKQSMMVVQHNRIDLDIAIRVPGEKQAFATIASALLTQIQSSTHLGTVDYQLVADDTDAQKLIADCGQEPATS